MVLRDDLLELRPGGAAHRRSRPRPSLWTGAALGTALFAAGCAAPPSKELEPALGPARAEASPAEAPSPAIDASARDARRRELVARVAAEPDWNLYDTGAHFVATPVDDPWLVERARERLEATAAWLAEHFAPPPPDPTRDPLVRVFADRETYRASGGAPGTTGFWSSTERSLVIFDAGDAADRAEVTWPALQHVSVHAFLDDRVGLDAVPPWLLFGLAGHVEGLEPDGDGVLAPPLEGDRWTHLRQVTAAEGPPPLGRLFAFDEREFRGENELGSGGWRNLVLSASLIAYLLEEQPQESAQGALPQALLEALHRGHDASASLEALLPEPDLQRLEADWRAWIETRIGRGL